MFKEYIISLIQQYGNIGILTGLALEFIGFPIPGEPLMSFLGYLSWKNTNHSLVPSVIFAVMGTNLGSIFAYIIGFKYGENIFIKYGKYIFITEEKLQKTKKIFSKNRIILLLFSRYIPGIRHVTPYLSGISKIKVTEYLIYNFIGSLIWCTFFIGLGYILGENWNVIEKLSRAYLLIFILIAIFMYVVFRYFNKHKITIFIITFPMLLFIKLSEDLIGNELSIFDNAIYMFLSKLILPNLTIIMKAISNTASLYTLILIAVASFIVLRKNRKYASYASIIAINLAASALFSEVFKFVFHRQRPEINELIEVGGFSFPSGHSMIGMSFYGLLLYLFFINTANMYKKFLIAAFFSMLILSIGISRIYLGVHYASDVLAGFSAGLAWLAIFITFMIKYFQKPKID